MNIRTNFRERVEKKIGRSFMEEELQSISKYSDLSESDMLELALLADINSILAVNYLRVKLKQPDLRVITNFVNEVLYGSMEISEWEAINR